MADEKEIKRKYNVPLRKGFIKAPNWKKTKKASKTLKEFLAKHMKTDIDKVKIGKNLNEHIWKHGIRNPPHHVKVEAIKDKEGIVKAELEGHEYKSFKKQEKKEKGALAQAVDKLKGGKKEEKKESKEKKVRTKDKVKAKKETKQEKTETKEPDKKEEKPKEKKEQPKQEEKKQEEKK